MCILTLPHFNMIMYSVPCRWWPYHPIIFSLNFTKGAGGLRRYSAICAIWVHRRARQGGPQGTTVRMSTSESMAEWTARDCTYEYMWEHGRVDRKGLYLQVHMRARQSGPQGTVPMSTCESTAEWTARDCTYKYMWEHGRVDRKGLYLQVHVRAWQSGPQGTVCSIS
jgi:hypothetical protein